MHHVPTGTDPLTDVTLTAPVAAMTDRSRNS